MMNKRSSIEDMNEELKRLNSIRQVDVPDQMYDQLLSRIKDKVQNRISFRQLKIVAAGVALLLFMDGIALFRDVKKDKKEKVETLISVQDNMLYNE